MLKIIFKNSYFQRPKISLWVFKFWVCLQNVEGGTGHDNKPPPSTLTETVMPDAD